MMWAFREGHAAVVNLLLEKGAKPEATDNNGEAALS